MNRSNPSPRARLSAFSEGRRLGGGSRLASLGVMAMAALFASPLTLGQNSQSKAAPPKAISENERIVHVLNRLGFGARPNDVDRVKQIGLSAYIEQQLYPDRIDDSAVEQKLRGYAELNFSDAEIESRYNAFITADQALNKLRQQIRKAAAQSKGTESAAAPAMSGGSANPFIGGGTGNMPANGGANPPKTAANQQGMRELMAADPELRQQFLIQRDELARVAEPVALLHEEFDAAKLIRAVESSRQLQEVLVDFWSNHFNIDIRKAPCGVLKVLDDRDVIRPHIWGKFRDLLEASAKSPAMLVYLDNYQSVADQLPGQNVRRRFPRRRNAPFLGTVGDPNAPQMAPAMTPPPIPQRRKVGLNENYAREIMELHTLGVDGGYTQQDVHEVARCFTGWSVAVPNGRLGGAPRYGEAGEFMFRPFVHDNGEKVVLGHRIPAGGGIEDGETVLQLLAENPATWRHLSYQLCQRLVCDEPPASLVNKCVQTWQRTGGDLREVVRTIVTSPEFFSPVSVRRKIKSPFEYAVSCVRALDGTLYADSLVSRLQIPREANSLVRPPQGGGYIDLGPNTLLGQIGLMGEPIFQYQAPTGFPEDSRKWVSSGALISRLNFSLALTQGRLVDVRVPDLSEDSGAAMDPNATITLASTRILHGEVSPSTRATLIREAKGDTNAPVTPATVAALLLGSPEFQRR